MIKDEDIIGNYKGESTIDLNGNITDGTYLNLKEIEFADFKLTNVRVWVTCETEEQLMLNKEELGRLGAISTWGNGLKIVR